MLKARLAIPVLLYFYQEDITQDDVNKVLEHFKDKDVQFRKVHDINDTRDIVERCEYASGTVPLIYFVRKAEGVLTKGVLTDPLKQPNAAKSTSKDEGLEAVEKGDVTLQSGHIQPSDANVAAKLLKEEIEAVTAEKSAPEIKASDVTVDEHSTKTANSVTGQLPTDVAQPEAAPAKPTAPAKPAAAPAKPK